MGPKLGFFRVPGREFWGKLSLPSFFLSPYRQLLSSAAGCVKGFVLFFSPLHPHSALSVECGENPSSQYVSRRVKGKGKVNNAC